MALNLERFEKDFDRLIENGNALYTGLVIEAYGKTGFVEEYKKAGCTDRDIDVLQKSSLSFSTHYQSWYSECLAVLKAVLPDRLADFISHYEPAKNRKEIDYSTYVIKDALLGSVITRVSTGKVVADQKAAIAHFQNQLAMVQAAKSRFRSSLFEIRQLVQADLFDSEIDAARELLRNRFIRASGAMAGVVLERHLRQVCDDHSIKVAKKNPGISDLNELLKSNGVIGIPEWRHITFLGDIRNLCDHNRQSEPSDSQVTDLIEGTSKILRTIA